MKLSNKTRGISALIALTFGFGLIAIAARYLSYHFTLFQQLYLTIGTAFIFGLFVFNKNLHVRKIKNIPAKDWLIIFIRSSLGYLLAASLYRESIVLTKISNVVFLQSIPFVAILGFLFFKEKVTNKKILFVSAAFLGSVLISVKDYSNIFIFGKGELFSLISGFLFGLSFAIRKWQTDFLNNQEITELLFFVSFLLLFAASLISGEKLPNFNWSFLILLIILINGFINTVNLFLVNYGFQKVPAVLASNILTLESVFGTILAFIFYNEIPSFKELLGGTLIIFSVIQMNQLESS